MLISKVSLALACAWRDAVKNRQKKKSIQEGNEDLKVKGKNFCKKSFKKNFENEILIYPSLSSRLGFV